MDLFGFGKFIYFDLEFHKIKLYLVNHLCGIELSERNIFWCFVELKTKDLGWLEMVLESEVEIFFRLFGDLSISILDLIKLNCITEFCY